MGRLILFRNATLCYGDISLTDYLEYLGKTQNGELIFPLYCNDAEVFDYRPGRFSEERTLHPEGEWSRIKKLLDTISSNTDIEYIPLKLYSAVLKQVLSACQKLLVLIILFQ